jgi:hypothetical protein
MDENHNMYDSQYEMEVGPPWQFRSLWIWE